MSLHLANLSPRMRKDELERVFRRFGRCTVQLKDGYGFAVYDFRGDAEKALRTLKGRKICGESVYLSWSNKQPKPLQRFARAVRSHDIRYGRNSDRDDSLVGRRDFSMRDKKQPDKGRERHNSAEIHDDRRDFNLNDAGLHYGHREVVLEEGGHIEVELNQMDDGRWGEQVDNLQNDTGYDEQMGFDRYEPDFVDERGEENEKHGLDHFADSQSVGTSPDKNRRVHPNNKRGKLNCFSCGAAGHKMRDCPGKDALQEKSTYHSDHRHDTKAKNEVGKTETRSGGQGQSSSRKLQSARQPDTDRKLSHSEKDGVNSKSSPIENKSRWDRRKDYNRSRQRERNAQTVESHDDKKPRVSSLAHLHSDCPSPELGTNSRPIKPSEGLSSHIKSGSPRPNSLSARSRSNSRSRRSRSNSRPRKSRSRRLNTKSRSRSKSKSRSRSPSSSLSISLGRSLPSSPNKGKVSLNDFSEGGLSPLSKEVLTEVRPHVEPEVREENHSIANRAEHSSCGYPDDPSSYQIMEHSKHDSETLTFTKHAEVKLNDFVEGDLIPQYQEAVLDDRQQLEPVQNFKRPQTDASLLSEDVSFPGKVIVDMKLDQSLTDAVKDSTAPHLFCEVEASSSSLLEKDDNECAAVKTAAEKPKETEEIENTNALELNKSLEPANNSDMVAPSKLLVGSHLSISAEELSRVLKHYGLKHPEENERLLDVGDYFGSSRLWPWEMIYYRRLKKGPISMENYARRVAQNEAFHITDKYIRSSSGWGESIEERH